jgi:hypothetical protein
LAILLKLTTITKILTIIAGIIFLISFFLPSHLTSVDFKTFIEFAENNQIGYGIYMLALFPLTLILTANKKYLTSLYLTTSLILTQYELFDDFVNFILNRHLSIFSIASTYHFYPFLIVASLLFWLTYKSIKAKSWYWYLSFIVIVFLIYILFNDNNCRIEFVSDMGIIKNDIRLWFSNCGTYYAWWTSIILQSIAIFSEIKYISNSAGNSPVAGASL